MYPFTSASLCTNISPEKAQNTAARRIGGGCGSVRGIMADIEISCLRRWNWRDNNEVATGKT